jgi:SNF2 family DNA or RNA helicase
MNVLMQLRKVCNHPDLFDSRDYVTPSSQFFQIFYYIPSIILNLFCYDPMKTTNLKHLNFIFEEFEKISKFDYLSLVKNFPIKPFYQIMTEIIESKLKNF